MKRACVREEFRLTRMRCTELRQYMITVLPLAVTFLRGKKSLKILIWFACTFVIIYWSRWITISTLLLATNYYTIEFLGFVGQPYMLADIFVTKTCIICYCLDITFRDNRPSNARIDAYLRHILLDVENSKAKWNSARYHPCLINRICLPGSIMAQIRNTCAYEENETRILFYAQKFNKPV